MCVLYFFSCAPKFFYIPLPLKIKYVFYYVKKIAYFLCQNQKHHDKPGDCGQQRLFLSAGTGQQLVQHGDNHADAGYFENQIHIQVKIPPKEEVLRR